MSRSMLRSSLALFVIGLCSGAAGSARAAVHEVLVESLSFSPANLQIEAGDTVHWIWAVGIHTVTSGTGCVADGLFDAPLDSGNPEFSFTFDDPGMIDYFCTPHCGFGMVGSIEVTGTSDVSETSASTQLSAMAYPNPFSTGTEIQLSLSGSDPVRIDIFDAAGRRTASLGEVGSTRGSHNPRWDGNRSDGTKAPAGIYYALVSAGSNAQVVRLVKVD